MVDLSWREKFADDTYPVRTNTHTTQVKSVIIHVKMPWMVMLIPALAFLSRATSCHTVIVMGQRAVGEHCWNNPPTDSMSGSLVLMFGT